ncbi:MAG: nitrophenyl compound nitroreductase subunit ArsF family protein [Bacteroidales bacterium]|nr:nitrophenyl compound nitroreductase subunit ArsF family protein [Bacteroidales bacterium]
MKNLISVTLIIISVFSLAGCKNNSDKKTDSIEESKVMVYYFHGEQRCPTCIAVGEVSQETVKAEFGENEDVTFKDVDFSTEDGEPISDKYEIASSSLLIVSGENIVDVTDDAFAFARNDPDKLKKIIIDQINKML